MKVSKQRVLRRPIREFVSRQKIGRIVAIALGLWILLAGETSLVQLWKLKKVNTETQEEIGRLEGRLEDLAAEEENLQNPEHLEKLAREEYGMIRDGETAYRIVDTEAEE